MLRFLLKFAILSFSLVGLASAEVSVGDVVCVEGYIMDTYCIERGTLLDNPSVNTLEGPDKHTIHCLVDVPNCYNSGYEVLIEPLDGDKEHCRGFALDDSGTEEARKLAQSVGSKSGCSTCTGANGSERKGFRATVKGRVTDVGNGKKPAELSVLEVLRSSVGCDEGATKLPLSAAACVRSVPVTRPASTPSPIAAPTPVPTPLPFKEPTVAEPVVPIEFELAMDISENLKMEYGINVIPTNIFEKGDTISVKLTYDGEDEGWLGFAISRNGLMIGSEAIIGISGGQPPQKFLLGDYSEDSVLPMGDSQQTLINHSFEQADGKTILSFTKLLKEEGEIEIKNDAMNTFLWAKGGDFGYHGFGNRGAFTLLLAPTDQPTSVPTGSPTGEPTDIPIGSPTDLPTSVPTRSPTDVPTSVPTVSPADVPTPVATLSPTDIPTSVPTAPPIDLPISVPTESPANFPTSVPTVPPIDLPTSIPTEHLIDLPTSVPTVPPTDRLTLDPTGSPTDPPTLVPTLFPSDLPTSIPTNPPTSSPSAATQEPSSMSPTAPTTSLPTTEPTDNTQRAAAFDAFSASANHDSLMAFVLAGLSLLAIVV